MVKKRLSDVLRDEAQKSLQPDHDVEIEVDAQVVSNESEDADQNASPVPADQPEVEQLLEAAAPEKAASGESSRFREAPPKPSHSNNAQIAALQADLQAARQQEQQLKQQIAALQADLQTQQDLVKQLQADRSPAESLKAELEEAKQVILKLSAPAAKSPAPAPAPPPPPAPAKAAQPAKKEPQGLQLRTQPRRPTEIYPAFVPKMSSETDTRLTDADIGWVD